MRRREILTTLLGALTIGAVATPGAWAGGMPASVEAWLRDMVALKDALQTGAISVEEWQGAVEARNRTVSIAELSRAIDAEAVARRFAYPAHLSSYADPVLPPEILGAAGMDRWFFRLFGMRRGANLLPHIHNNMVSAHLVLAGSFRVRTHDRLRDVADAVVLRPVRDEIVGPGAVITMSDQHENQHWLVAQEDRSLTLDIGIQGLDASWSYGLVADANSTRFVDPRGTPTGDGTIIAPVLTFEQAMARFC